MHTIDTARPQGVDAATSFATQYTSQVVVKLERPEKRQGRVKASLEGDGKAEGGDDRDGRGALEHVVDAREERLQQRLHVLHECPIGHPSGHQKHEHRVEPWACCGEISTRLRFMGRARPWQARNSVPRLAMKPSLKAAGRPGDLSWNITCPSN